MTGQLTLLTWPDYINPQTLVDFEQEFDAKVILAIVPSAVELIQRMKSMARGVDVLVPPDYAVRELSADGKLAQLDHSLLPNLQHIEPRFREGRPHDPSSSVSVVKDWGTTGFMYRSDLVRESPQSWADFWQIAEQYSGRVTVLDSPGEVIGAALKMRGRSYNESAPDVLSRTRDDLLHLRSHLLAFETDYKPLLARGSACIALGWNGDAAALQAQGVPIRYVIPTDGSQIWEDDWALSREAADPVLAHALVNFLLRPEIAAQEARHTRYATANREGRLLLPPKDRDDLSIYPPDSVLSQLEAGLPLDAAGQQRRDELWAAIRA
jgi:spermidine/putrescine transport system substrate-binding protein